MEPFDVRTTPARLKARYHLLYGAMTVTILWLLWRAVTITSAALSRGGLAGLLLVAFVVLVLAALYIYSGTAVQVFLFYNLRDRGREVVAFRVEPDGIRWLLAGANVLVPWDGLSAEVVLREPGRCRVALVSPGPFRHRWDPLSLGFVRRMRKGGRYNLILTTDDSTDSELAAAIERLSGGRVRLGLSPS